MAPSASFNTLVRTRDSCFSLGSVARSSVTVLPQYHVQVWHIMVKNQQGKSKSAKCVASRESLAPLSGSHEVLSMAKG